MTQLNLGQDFDDAVITAAGLDPAWYEPGSLIIDFVPTDGDATIRTTSVHTVDAAQLRELIVAAAQPPAS